MNRKENFEKINEEQKEILLKKVRIDELTAEDLKMLNDCIEYELSYKCICFLLELEDKYSDLKYWILSDLRFNLGLEEVKKILNSTFESYKSGNYYLSLCNIYKLHKEKYILEKNLTK